MIKNWKTTVAGVLVAFATILPNLSKPEQLVTNPTNLTSLLAAAGLIVAKDHNVTGGS